MSLKNSLKVLSLFGFMVAVAVAIASYHAGPTQVASYRADQRCGNSCF